MNRSFQSVVIAFFVSLLFIAGCSDNKSTSGVSLSKEAKDCYSEYVDLHGDIKNAYKREKRAAKDNGNFGHFPSKSEYGKAHYEGTGANEGRALPKGCGEHLKVSSTCYKGYVDNHGDLNIAWRVSSRSNRGQDKSDFGKKHYKAFGETEGRKLPKGCTYLAAPANPCKDKGIDDVTYAQWKWFIKQTPALSGYTPKSAKHWYCTDAKGYGNPSLTPPGQCPTGYTGTAPYCVEEGVEEASSSSSGGGGTGISVNIVRK